MYSGYWKVVVEEEVHRRLEFFTLYGNWWWKVIPMEALDAAPTFVAMMTNLQMGWDKLAKERGLKSFASKIIVDDVLLYGRTADMILDYFITVLYILKHHRATLKLKIFKWFQDRYEFVGMDVAEDGTEPTQSKNEAFAKLEQSTI